MNDKFGTYKDWMITSLDDGRFEINGYTYNDDGDFGTDYYDDVMRMINSISDSSGSMSSETLVEKAARELREKSINREKKINEILGE